LPAATQKIFIDGPAGKIETILSAPASTPQGIAIIAHPHPLHGGTMDNKVIQTLFNTLQLLDFAVVKFNFRGVGASDGVFDHGTGEIDDVIAVTAAIRNRFSDTTAKLPLLLGGFSFGGGIQLHAAEKLNPEFLILIAPSVANLKAPPVSDSTQLTLIIQGDRDDIVLPEQIFAWVTPKSQPIVFIPGAGHFFHGKLMLLKQLILEFFSNKT
jgi:alpha/beta superfamily hydrolase